MATSSTGNVINAGNFSGLYGNPTGVTQSGSNYSNANVINFLPIYSGNLGAVNSITASGNIRGNSIVGNVFMWANGTPLVQPPAYGNANVAAWLPTNTNANILAPNISVTGTANIGTLRTNNYQFANGTPISFAGNYSNANVAAYLAVGNNTSNINGGNLFIISNITANTVSAASTVISPKIVGNTVSVIGGLTVLGNSNASVLRSYDAFTGIDVIPGNGIVNIQANVRAGNVFGNYYFANGQPFASYGNANVAQFLPTYTGNVGAGNVNVTSNVTAYVVQTTGVGGDITGANTISGNTVITNSIRTDNYLYANGQPFAGGGGSSYGNANVAAYLPTYTGNISAKNVSATSNIVAGRLQTVGTAGNITGVNKIVTTTMSAFGNVYPGGILTDNYYYANGVPVNFTGAQYGNTNVEAYLPVSPYIGNITGNVTSLTGALSNTNNNITTLTSSVSGVNANVVSLTGSLANTNSNVANTNTTVSVVQGEVASLTGSLANTNSNVSNTNSNVSTLTTSVTGINTKVTSLTGSISNTNSNVATLTTSVTGITSNVTTLQGQVTSLTGSVYTNANVAAYLPTDPTIIGINSNVSNTNSNVSNTNSNVAINTSAIASLTGNVYNNANVAAYLPTYGGIVNAQQVSNVDVVNMATQGTVQLQYDPTGAYNVYDIATGSWAYIDSSGLSFQSNVTGNVASAYIDNSANFSAAGNISGNYIIGDGSLLTNINAGNIIGSYGNSNVANYLPTDSTIIAIENSISNTNSNVSNLANVVGSNSTDIVALQSGLSNTNSNVSNLTTSVTGIASGLANTNSNVSNNTSNIATLQTEVASLTGNVNTYGNANVAAYLPTDPTIITIQSDIGNTNSNVSNTNSNVSALTSDLANTNSNVTTLTNNTANSFSNVNSNISNTNSNVSTLTTSVSGITTNVTSLQGQVASLTGNVYGNANVAAFLPTYTGNLAGNNLTAGGFTLASNIITTGTGANLTLDPNGTGGIDGNVIVAGNLVVQGTTTTINSNTVSINDLLINVANNAATATEANGGGIGVGPVGAEYAKMTYNSTYNRWDASLGISSAGNIAAPYFIGDGSLLTNINAGNIIGGYGNSNVAAYLPTYTGNLAGGNVSVTGNVQGSYVLGNGAFLTGIATTYGNSNVAAYIPTDPYIGSITGNVTSLQGQVASLTGNVNTYGNANVAAYLPTYSGNLNANNITGGTISTTGQITGTIIQGNSFRAGGTSFTISGTGGLSVTSGPLVAANISAGNISTSGLISATGNITGNNISATNISAGGTTTLGIAVVNTNIQLSGAAPISMGTGNITTGGNISATANIIAGNVRTAGLITATGNIQGGNLITAGSITATGNIQGNVFIGNGAGLTNIPAGNIIGAYGNSNVAAYIPTDPYIGSITGNVTSLQGQVASLTGNVYGNANVAAYLPTYNGNIRANNLYVVNNLSLSGEVTGGNLSVGSITGSFITSQTNVSAVGNIQGGNIRTAGLITATGNISGNVFIGNGAGLTNIPAGNIIGAYGNSNVAAYIPTDPYIGSMTGNVTTLQGNVVSLTEQSANNAGNITTLQGNVVSLTGAIANTNSNVANTNSNVSTLTTSVTGITGNVATLQTQVTSLSGNVYTNANVAAFMATQTGNVSAGNIISSNIQGDAVNTLTLTSNNSNVGDIHLNAGNIRFGKNNQDANIATRGTGNMIISTNEGGANQGNIILVNGAGGNIQINPNDGGLLVVSKGITAVGNIQGNYILGNGAFLTGITAGTNYSNANVAAYIPTDPYIGSITGNVTTLQGNVVSLTGAISNTNSNVSNTNSNVSTLTTSVAGLTTDIANTNSNVSNTNSNVSTLTSSVSGITANVTSLTGSLANTNSNVSNTNSNVSTLTTSVSGITSNVANLQTQVSSLSGNVYGNANVAAYLPTYTGNLTAGNVSTTGNIQGTYIKGDGSLLTNLPAGNYSNANVAAYLPTYTGNIAGGNISLTGYLYGNGAFLTGISGSGSNYGDSNVASYIATATGNVSGGNILSNTVYGYGTATSGFGAVYTGPVGYAALPSTTIQVTANANTYAQMNAQNLNTGTQATTDYVATADNGSDTQMFIDLGIAGSNYSNTSANNSLGTAVATNDAYLYTVGSTATGNTTGGNLVLAAVGAGRNIKFVAGGSGAGNVVGVLNANSISFGQSATANSTSGIAIGVGAAANTATGSFVLATNSSNVSSSLTATGNVVGTMYVGMVLQGNGWPSGSTTIVTITNGSVVGVNNTPTLPMVAGQTLTGTVMQQQGGIAIGNNAGFLGQGANSVAIGVSAGRSSQGIQAIAIGATAGLTLQGSSAIAIGAGAGTTSQGGSAVAIGINAGSSQQVTQAVAVGQNAGQTSQSQGAIAIGSGAGQTNQSIYGVAVGFNAGQSIQGTHAVAVGFNAGQISSGANVVAIGYQAGQSVQANAAVAIGYQAGQAQGQLAVAMGYQAGQSQQQYAIAIGYTAGRTNQQNFATAIGPGAGSISQQADTVAIGRNPGGISQQASAIAIGLYAGYSVQGTNAIAMGPSAGGANQLGNAIAIGFTAGNLSQAGNAIAIGQSAGKSLQGANSIAIGALAGFSGQGNNSIIINATGNALTQTTANTFTVKPVRSATGTQQLYYDNTSGEVTYAPAPAVNYVFTTSVSQPATTSGGAAADWASSGGGAAFVGPNIAYVGGGVFTLGANAVYMLQGSVGTMSLTGAQKATLQWYAGNLVNGYQNPPVTIYSSANTATLGSTAGPVTMIANTYGASNATVYLGADNNGGTLTYNLDGGSYVTIRQIG